MIVTYAGELELLLAGVGGDLATAKVILSKSAVDESKAALVGDFDPPDYNTYASQSVSAWGVPYVALDGTARVDGGDYLFQPTDALAPNLIYAWGLTNSGGTLLYAMEAFANPVPLNDALHGVLVDLELVWPA